MLRRTKIILFPALLLICIGLVMYFARNGQADPPQNFTHLPAGTNAIAIPSKAEWAKMSDQERLQWLERNGELPHDASAVDRQLVEQTSWWGNPLDPKTFWKDKTVWLDLKARLAAHKLGRLYPPIPFGETNFSSYSEKDIADRTGGSEGGSTVYHSE